MSTDANDLTLADAAAGLAHAAETFGSHCSCESDPSSCPMDRHQHAALANLRFLQAAFQQGDALAAFDEVCEALKDVAFTRSTIKDGPRRFKRKKRAKGDDTVEEKDGQVTVHLEIDWYKTVPIGTVDGAVFFCGGCETQPKRDRKTRQVTHPGHQAPLRLVPTPRELGQDMPQLLLICIECRAIVKPSEAFAVLQGAMDWCLELQDKLAPPSKAEVDADKAEMKALLNKPKAEDVDTGLVDGRGNKITKRAAREGDSPIVRLS